MVVASLLSVRVPSGRVEIDGDLAVPSDAFATVVFAHGSGSGRHSPRNRHVAESFRAAGLATLLLDLLTPEEVRFDERTRALRFDIDLLSARLIDAVRWLARSPGLSPSPAGLFGSSTGAAAALVAAAHLGDGARAVVSRGGRPDLAIPVLDRVRAATLLIVGGEDREVLRLNLEAYEHLRGERDVHVVPGAGHLFEEPGALDEVTRVASEWFVETLGGPPRGEAPS
jgi:dienelactone hydrolase